MFANLALANSVLACICFREFCFRNLALGNLHGEAGGTRRRESREPGEATNWALFMNDNSKNPSKQSVVKEQYVKNDC